MTPSAGLGEFQALQRVSTAGAMRLHPRHVFRPFEGLDMWCDLYHNADTREEVSQGLDTW